MRGGAKPAAAPRDAVQHLRTRGAVLVEQLPGPVGAQPLLQLPQVLGVVPDRGQRHLVGTPRTLHRQTVDLRGTGPALGRTQHDHRPAGPVRDVVLASRALNRRDAVQRGVHRAGHRAVDGQGVVTGDVDRIVAVATQQLVQFCFGEPCQDGRVGDLVAVQVQDRQDGAVADRVEELVRVPGSGQRPGLRLAVTNHTGDEQVRVVEGGAVGVGEAVAQLPALVNRARRLGSDVAGHPTREGELLEEPGHAGRVSGDVRVRLSVRTLQPGVGQHRGSAVAGPPDAQGVQAAGLDDAVEVGVHQVQARRGAPMPKEPRLDVLGAQGLGQQGVGHEVDLADGQIVRGAPVGIQRPQLLLVQLSGRLLRFGGHRDSFPAEAAHGLVRGGRCTTHLPPEHRVPDRAVRATRQSESSDRVQNSLPTGAGLSRPPPRRTVSLRRYSSSSISPRAKRSARSCSGEVPGCLLLARLPRSRGARERYRRTSRVMSKTQKRTMPTGMANQPHPLAPWPYQNITLVHLLKGPGAKGPEPCHFRGVGSSLSPSSFQRVMSRPGRREGSITPHRRWGGPCRLQRATAEA